MKTVSWTANSSWDEVLRLAGEEDVLVLRDSHPVVLMTPFGDDDLAWYARERDPAFLASFQCPPVAARSRHACSRFFSVCWEHVSSISASLYRCLLSTGDSAVVLDHHCSGNLRGNPPCRGARSCGQ